MGADAHGADGRGSTGSLRGARGTCERLHAVARTEPDEFDEAEVSVDELAHLLDEVRALRREVGTDTPFDDDPAFDDPVRPVPAAALEEALARVDPTRSARPAPRAPVALQPPPLTLLPRSRDGAARVIVVIAVVASLALLAQAYLFTWSR